MKHQRYIRVTLNYVKNITILHGHGFWLRLGRDRKISAICAALLGTMIFSPTASAVDPWTLAVVGDQQVAIDRQNYEEYYTSTLALINWIGGNAQANNIRFAAQVGDVVEHGDDLNEFDRAIAAMQILDTSINADGGTGIPWNVAYGNHEVDWTQPGTDPAGVKAHNYRDYFGSAGGMQTHRYTGQIGFGGVSSNDLNTYHYVSASSDPNSRTYLLLNLEYDVPGHPPGSTPPANDIPAFDAIAWAQGVIDANPNMPTIINTHVYAGTVHGPPTSPYTSGPGRNSQYEIFNKLINNNPQVFLVHSGHTGQNTYNVRYNSLGQPVLQMVVDFHKSLPKEYVRLIEFDEDAGQINVSTFCPGVPQDPAPHYLTDSYSQYSIEMDWATRFDGVTHDPPSNTRIFQFGVDHGQGIYSGTIDTHVDQLNPTVNYGGDTSLPAMNGTYSGAPRLQQVLIRFEDIFGTESQQVPLDATSITSAKLTMYTAGSQYNGTHSDVEYGLYPMLTSWDANATYNSFGGDGIQTNGMEASSTAEAIAPMYIGDSDPVTFDVTSSVQAWLAGSSTNYGWVIHDPNFRDDRWTIISSEGSIGTMRPKLEITFEEGTIIDPPPPSGLVDTYIGDYGGGADTDFSQVEKLGVMGPYNDQEMQALLRFDGLEDELADIPEGEWVDSATLSIQTGSALYDGTSPSTVTRLHRLLQPFDETGTWNSSFGGDGVQADGIEAVATADVVHTGNIADGELVEFDVTASLQAWAGGAPNHGWVILQEAEGSNRWYFMSAESSTPAVLEYTIGDEALPGDLNGDGFVGGDDLDIVRGFWGQNVTAGDLLEGDPSGDGFVGGDDLDIVRANWGQGAPPSPNAVPEPATFVGLLMLVAASLVCWRRGVH